ncbi:MAG: class I SAM-dependent methyltransferase [Porticoccaceae bacterium]|nr:class I SAM-dependent methyltransferase [Porticoccaceae bacterium]
MAQSIMQPFENCPLCAGTEVADYHRDQRRAYLQCLDCQLVFVPQRFHLSADQEKAEYDLHENDPRDPDYRSFLNRLAEPLLERLEPQSQGLDFGCGPGPCLSLMLEESGHSVALYDLYYANYPALFEVQYDFITATEVVEHLARPLVELETLWGLLKPGGQLAMMTKLVASPEKFASWHYKSDPTHISFFSDATFNYLGERWGSAPEFICADVILFQK